MTMEEFKRCAIAAAAVATTVTLIGGPIGYSLYILDEGMEEATTRCETRRFSEVSYLRNLQTYQYALYLNTKLNLLSLELGKDFRITDGSKLSRDVLLRERAETWEQVRKLGESADEALEKAEECPDYGGILQ